MKMGGRIRSGGGGKMVSDKIRRYNQIRKRNGEKPLKERDILEIDKQLYVRFISGGLPSTEEEVKVLHSGIKKVLTPAPLHNKFFTYAFVEFSTDKECADAKEQLSAMRLEGRKLRVELVGAKNARQLKEIREKKGEEKIDRQKEVKDDSKVLHLKFFSGPMPTEKEEVKALHSGIIEVRTPRPFKKGGFSYAYAEFSTKEECLAAKEELSSMKLEGREIKVNFAHKIPTDKNLKNKETKEKKETKGKKETKRKNSRSLFIKFLSLPLPTTKEEVQALHPGIKEVKVKFKQGSFSHAFVEFSTKEECIAAKEELSSMKLEGREIRVDFASGTPKDDREENESADRELFVKFKSGPFPTGADEVKALHSGITGVKFPSSQNNDGYSYAFVLFSTKEECVSAKEELSSMKLDGREIDVAFVGRKATKDEKKEKLLKKKDVIEPSQDKIEPCQDKIEPSQDKIEPVQDKIELAEDKIETAEDKIEPSQDKLELAEDKKETVQDKTETAQDKKKKKRNKKLAKEKREKKKMEEKIAKDRLKLFIKFKCESLITDVQEIQALHSGIKQVTTPKTKKNKKRETPITDDKDHTGGFSYCFLHFSTEEERDAAKKELQLMKFRDADLIVDFVREKAAGESNLNVTEEIVAKKEVVHLTKDKIESAVGAFLKLHDINTKAKEEEKKCEKSQLFESDQKFKISLKVTSIKIGDYRERDMLRVRLPHKFLKDEAEVLLVVKDLTNAKNDFDKTINDWKDLLAKHKVEGITEIMTYRQLRDENEEYEAKNNLYSRWDRILVDTRRQNEIPAVLGKLFYKRKNRLPIYCNLSQALKNNDLKTEIENCLCTSLFPISNAGIETTPTVGNTDLTPEQITENVQAVVELMEDQFPGGWMNVRSIYLHAIGTSLPLYYTDRSNAEIVGKVQTKKFEMARQEAVSDELSTIPGATVTVTPRGIVTVKRVVDEEWDTEIENRKWLQKRQKYFDIKDNHPDDFDDTIHNDSDADADKHEDKEEKEAKKKSKKDKKSKKQTREKTESDDDDDLENMELEYMKKVAEEEEEFERQEAENLAKLGGARPEVGDKADENDEDDEGTDDDDEGSDEADIVSASDADDDIEAEDHVESGDDSGDDHDIIMQRNDESEADEDQPAKPKKKKISKKKMKKANKEAKKNNKQSPASKNKTPSKSDKKLKGVRDGKVKKK